MKKKYIVLTIVLFLIIFIGPFWFNYQDQKRLRQLQSVNQKLTGPTNFKKIQNEMLYRGYEKGLRGEELIEWSVYETLRYLQKEQEELMRMYRKLN